MNVKQVKETMRTWILDNVDQYPGLRFAHHVGSITSYADDAPFPVEKDVDFHMVFEPGSPALAPNGPFSNNLEFLHQGLMVEGGLKPVGEYRDAETILANPEIAYHLTKECVLYDPNGELQAMMPRVKAEFNKRRWVLARIEYERQGWESIAELYNQIPESAASMKIGLMGYGFTRLSCVMCDVTLQAPKIGHWKMREILLDYGRSDLYETQLALFGLDKATPELAMQFFREATEAFDLASRIRKTPHPFQHKLHPHLRPYFVDKFQRLFEEDMIIDAMAIIHPFYISSCGVIMTDGSPAQKEKYGCQLQQFLDTIGLGTLEIQQAKWAESRALGKAVFDLARDIALTNPNIVD